MSEFKEGWMHYSFFSMTKKITKDQQGATAVMVAVALTALFGFVALGIDVGNLCVTRNQLQNIADAAALAGTRQLGRIYQPMTYDEQQGNDETLIKSAIHDVAGQNQAAELDSLTIPGQDILIGQWQANQNSGDPFTQTVNMPKAVRVIARRDAQANSPISTFFAGVIGTDLLSVSATATAALTGKGDAAPGELELPVGISSWWYENPEYCNDTIAFSPANSPDSCAGWTSFEISPANDITLRNIRFPDLGRFCYDTIS
jgi:Flp pilus assembly protein TadG